METIFINSENSKTNYSNNFFMNLLTSLILKLQIKIRHCVIQGFITNEKTLNLHITTINLKHQLQIEMMNFPDGSYSILHIRNYFEYSIIKKYETIADNLPIQIYINKIKNRIVFKIKTSYKLELLSKETMRLLGRTEKSVDKDKNSENLPKFETVEVILLHCNVVNNSYQQAPKVLFTFVLDKLFGQLMTIALHSLTMLKTTEF